MTRHKTSDPIYTRLLHGEADEIKLILQVVTKKFTSISFLYVVFLSTEIPWMEKLTTGCSTVYFNMNTSMNFQGARDMCSYWPNGHVLYLETQEEADYVRDNGKRKRTVASV